MRNDAGARGSRGGITGGKFTWRVISSYLRSVSSNAGNIAATVGKAGASIVSAAAAHPDDEKHREQVQWASLDTLELSASLARRVLLLTYLNGFQVWDVEDASNLRELVSKRDGRAAFLRLRPSPHEASEASEPLLLVVTGDVPRGGHAPALYSPTTASPAPRAVHPQFVPTVVRFYSMRTHAYVHELRFRTGICAVRCSRRVIAVALVAQIYCFDAATFQSIFSVLTYSTPNAGLGVAGVGYGALALGPRWMAYAANQPVPSSVGGRISPQNLTSPGISPSTSPGGGNLVAHYAKESSKQLAAGIMTLGDMGYKTLSRYCSDLLPDGVSPAGAANAPANGASLESEYAGTVIVRDYVSRKVVAQFRAHSSPISALCFDPSGTLLVTASVYGHNLNLFRLTPSPDNGGAPSKTSYVHLYKLCRGFTNAVIQDISFSHDSHWVAVSTSRATTHLFAISPFGGVVGPQTHGSYSVDPFNGPTVVPTPTYPWWTSTGPLRASQQALPPPPPAVTLSVVSRIKNGFGWRGTPRTNGCTATSGAVAAGFHGGDCRESEDGGNGCLKEKLLVLSPSAHFTRYHLKPSTGSGDAGAGYNTEDSSSPGQSQDLRLHVEPAEKWDVCRRVNWVEREGRSENLASGQGAGGGGGGSDREDCFSEDSLRSGKDCLSAEELHRWYMSNAEVQISQARPLPIWAKPNVYFHVMLVSGSNPDMLEIEDIPTQVLEVRRKDLKPLVERLQRLDMHARNLSSISHQLQPDYASTDPGIHRSSSGSSYGSEGPLADASCGSNSFHPNFQDFPDVYIAPTSPLCNHNPVNPGMLHSDLSSNPNTANGIRLQVGGAAVLTDTTSSPPVSIRRDKAFPGASTATSLAPVNAAVVGDEFCEAAALSPLMEAEPAQAAAPDLASPKSDQEHNGWEGTMFPFCEED